MVLYTVPASEKGSTSIRNFHGHRYTTRRIFAFWYAIHRLAWGLACLHTHQYQHYDTEFEGKGSTAKAKSEKCEDLRYQHFRKHIGSRGGPRVCLGKKNAHDSKCSLTCPKHLDVFALLPVCGARRDASRGGSMQDAGAASIVCVSMYSYYSLRWSADAPPVNGNTCNAISFHTQHQCPSLGACTFSRWARNMTSRH